LYCPAGWGCAAGADGWCWGAAGADGAEGAGQFWLGDCCGGEPTSVGGTGTCPGDSEGRDDVPPAGLDGLDGGSAV
jgi:hypothetical protein